MIEAAQRVEVTGERHARYDEILSAPALDLVASVHRLGQGRRAAVLAARHQRALAAAAGAPPPRVVVDPAAWQVEEIPAGLARRKVELAVPADPSSLNSALKTGAATVVADLEELTAPDWTRAIDAQIALLDHVAHSAMGFDGGPSARTRPHVMMRPRGLHLTEPSITVDGEPVAAAFADVTLNMVHTLALRREADRVVSLSLPRIDAAAEAALWDDVLAHIESRLGAPEGTVKVSVPIGSINAAAEADGIIAALRGRIVALTCGRWDYAASVANNAAGAHDAAAVLPDRRFIQLGRGFLRGMSRRVVEAAHRRGVLALAPMTAAVPDALDTDAVSETLERLRADCERAATDGHDGRVVAHPWLVAHVGQVFDVTIPDDNQVSAMPAPLLTGEPEPGLADPYEGERTVEGLSRNIRIALGHAEARLRGFGAVNVGGVVHGASSAELAVLHMSSWLRERTRLATGEVVDTALFEACLADELARLRGEFSEGAWADRRFVDAAAAVRRGAIGTAEAA
ncbi:hypothetical protein [Acuticoccus yangtzensis]|uniref:hypothetical protein n=1 Tax=Acuticoccus yangtzensis TaxID=1443441 RepID=UPI00094998B6|nr:hypothetical protein [Acuticoccus yangtzensis]